MNDQDKTKQQLIEELVDLRRRVEVQDAQLVASERAKAEQQQILNDLPVLIATAGFDGYYKQVNTAFERILGWSKQESLSKPLLDFIHPDDRAAALAAMERLRSGEKAANFVDRNACKDGSYRWINWNVIPVPDHDTVLGIGQDVTEKRRAEEEGRRSETWWRSVVGNAPVFLAVLDQENKIQFLNHAAPGMNVEDAIGKSTFDFLQPEYVAIARESIAKVRRTGRTALYECLGAGPNGSLSWYETHVGPIVVDDEIVAVSLIAIDVTERKNNEAALLEGKRRLSTLMSNLPGMAYRCRNDPNWTMEFVSEGALQLTGYHATDIIESRKVAYGDLIHPADRDFVWDQVQAGIDERRRFQIEYRICTADGDEKWVWEQGIGVFSEDRELQALEGFITNITERKKAKEELQKSHDVLEQRVRERTVDLVNVNQRLVNILESISDGFVSFDHEWRYAYANQAAAQYLRTVPEALVGKVVWDLFPKAAGLKFHEEFHRAVRDGHAADFEEFYPEPLNCWYECHCYPSPEGMSLFFRDITERKRDREALDRERRTLLHMLRASDHERQLISYDIHDGLAQQLAAAIMQFQAFDGLKKHDLGKAQTAHDAGVQMVRQAHSEARRLISGVRPPILDESGITAAIAHLVYEHATPKGPKIEFHSGVVVGRLATVLENAVYRIVQEALANALQHSGSENIRLSLLQEADVLCLDIQDWGTGFDLDTVDENRFGLEGIRERTRLLGGTCLIESEPGKGTCIWVTLPILEEDPSVAE